MSTVAQNRRARRPQEFKPLVSVIVCAYSDERLGQLRETIASLRDQTYATGDIVVIVDHNPALHEQLRTLTADGGRVAPNSGDRGLADARNSGIALARGEIVAFIDDDARADNGWLQRLVECYRDPAVIAAGGRIEPVWEGGRKPAWLPDEFLWVVGCTYRGMPKRRRIMRNMIGCNMSFRSEVFASVGRFDTAIGRLANQPLGGEETEICIRALNHWPDKKIVYTPDAVVYHHASRSRQTLGYFARRCYFEGVSKVIVRRLWGAAGTSSELNYLSRSLPRAIRRDVRNVIFLRDVPAALSRIGAIALGVGAVGAGFGAGMFRERGRRH